MSGVEIVRENPYVTTADALVERIRTVLRNKPEAADGTVFELFSHGLECDDLSPSLAQASWAFARAKHLEAIEAKRRGGK